MHICMPITRLSCCAASSFRVLYSASSRCAQLDSLAFIEALATCAPGGSPPAEDLIERGAAATLEQGPLTLPAAAMAPGVSVLCY